MDDLATELAARTEPAGDGAAKRAHEAREITEVVERLAIRFPHEDPDRIREVVNAAHQEFIASPIRDFVPVFVERAAKALLDGPAG